MSFQKMMFGITMIIIVTACAEYFAAAHPTREANLPATEREISDTINCVHQQHPCVRKGLLPHTDGKCYAPLERGPCPRGHVIVLDTKSAAGGLKGHCMEQRCSSGLVPLEGRCLPKAQVRRLLCGSENLHLDPAGSPVCGEFPGWKNLLRSYVQCSHKEKRFAWLDRGRGGSRSARVNNARCGLLNIGACAKQVSGVLPKIVLAPE